MKLIYLIVVFFCLLAWLLPNHYQPWLAVYQDSCMFIAIVFMALSLAQQKKIEIPFYTIFLILLSCIPLIQYFFGIIYFSGEALINSLYLLGFMTIFVVGFNIGKLEQSKKEQIISGFFITILIAGLISVWIQLRQWLLFNGNIWTVDMPPDGRPFANMAQPNQLSTLLLMGLLSVLYLFEKHKFNKISASFIAIFLLCGVVLTQSRTAWLFVLCMLVWWMSKPKIQTHLTLRHLVLWSILFLGLWFCLPYLSEFIGVTSTASLMERATTGLDRLPMWYQLIVIIQNGPIQGYGWGQLNVAQLLNNSEFINKPILGYSHNLFLDLFIWNGLLLGLIISCCILFFLLKLAVYSKDKESFLILAMVGAILLHSLLEYPFAYAYFLLPLGFFLGFLYAQQNEKNTFLSLDRMIYVQYLSCCLILMIIFFYDYKQVEHQHELMRYENVQLRNIDVNGIEPKVIFLNQLSEYVWFVRQPLKSGQSEQELQRMRKVVYRYPDRPMLYRYIQILCLNKKEREAEHIIKLFNAFYQEKLTLKGVKQGIQE